MNCWHYSCTLFNIFVIALAQSTLQTALKYETQHNNYAEFENSVQQLLSMIYEENNFEHIIIYATDSTDETFSRKTLKWPIIAANSKASYDYKAIFSIRAIILKFSSDLLSDFAAAAASPLLSQLKSLRHVIYEQRTYALNRTITTTIEAYCNEAFLNDVYNIVIILPDFGLSHAYYTCLRYTQHSKRHFKRKLLTKATVSIYEAQFKNMLGAAIATHPDQLLPRSMFYYDEQHKLQLGGYVGKLLTTFAQHYNATLDYKFPIEIGKIIFYELLEQAAINGTLDIAAALTTTIGQNNFKNLAYPYEIISYCYMVPLPRSMPIHAIFTSIVKRYALMGLLLLSLIFGFLLAYSIKSSCSELNLFNILLNDKCLRGMLGQSFPLPAQPRTVVKYICFLLCYMSLLTTTMYQAYLQSFLTQPPLEPTIKNVKDVLATNLKIVIPNNELVLHSTVPGKPLLKYPKIFKIISDFNRFQNMRASLNTAYIYPVANTRWLVFNEQQKLFERRLFYYAHNFCMHDFLFLSVPLRSNLPYREQFEHHIMRVHASGLMQHWISLNFYDMVKFGYLELKDSTHKERYGNPLELHDFYWIWLMYWSCIALSLLVFAAELLKFKLSR